jgi:hypothetical protein
MPPTPAERRLAGFLSPAFKKEAFRVDRSRPLTFICGGKDHNGVTPLRLQFLAHLAGSTPPILPLLSEKAFPHQLIERNLQLFETFLGSAADCVLIFVESPGSFAETGLFAALPRIMEKTFVVNTRDESREDSFLNLGPIKLIRKKSLFDSVFYLEGQVVRPQDAQGIIDCILKTVPKYDNALVFHPTKKFTELQLRLQLACIHMTVTLLRAGSASLVTSVIREHFKAVDGETIERFLSLLTSIEVLQRQDEIYFNPNAEAFKNDALICSTDFLVDEVKAQTLGWQAENNSQVVVFLREQRGIGI